MKLDLAGKVVLITGAAGGIGSAVARAFAAEGARVALLDWSESSLEPLALAITSQGGEASFAGANLSNRFETPAAITTVLAPYNGQVDILITVAGVCTPLPLDETLLPDTMVNWRDLFDMNVLTALLPITCVWPRMSEQGSGVILTTASDLARQPEPEMLIYSTAKAALVHLTHGLAEMLGPHGIRVAAVSPGPVRTSIWTKPGGLMDVYSRQYGLAGEEAVEEELRHRGLTRPYLIEPEEVADLMLYLASERAKSITRCVVDINGGSQKGY
jgi:NAD(P)-dependent dehydrogenase (short-subunit alcohol dehydrogenase family)